jgi:hypothetical protein
MHGLRKDAKELFRYPCFVVPAVPNPAFVQDLFDSMYNVFAFGSLVEIQRLKVHANYVLEHTIDPWYKAGILGFLGSNTKTMFIDVVDKVDSTSHLHVRVLAILYPRLEPSQQSKSKSIFSAYLALQTSSQMASQMTMMQMTMMQMTMMQMTMLHIMLCMCTTKESCQFGNLEVPRTK